MDVAALACSVIFISLSHALKRTGGDNNLSITAEAALLTLPQAFLARITTCCYSLPSPPSLTPVSQQSFQGPRLKIMNVLAKSSSGTNSSGSNSGSVSTPSPEPRLSPKTSASSHHSFPVGSMSLGMSSAAAAASGSALSARAWSSVDATPEPAAHLTDDGEDIPVTVTVLEGSSSVCSSAGGVSAAIEILSGGMDNGGGVFKGGDIEDSRSNKGEKVENEVKGVSEEEVAMLEEGAGLGLPPRWDSVTSAERSLSPPADVWVSSALASEGGDGGACTS